MLGSHVHLFSLWPRSAFGESVAEFPGIAVMHLVPRLVLSPNLCNFSDLSLFLKAFVEHLPVMSFRFFMYVKGLATLLQGEGVVCFPSCKSKLEAHHSEAMQKSAN